MSIFTIGSATMESDGGPGGGHYQVTVIRALGPYGEHGWPPFFKRRADASAWLTEYQSKGGYVTDATILQLELKE